MAARTYRTRQADTFGKIAYRLWGSDHFMRYLVAANPDYSDVLIFDAGVVLNVPNLVIRPQTASNLPAWY